MLATGLLLVIVGLCFLLVPLLTTFAAGVAAGILLIAAGAAQLLDATSGRAEGWVWGAAMGVLAGLAGVLLLVDPVGGMIGFTLLMACYLLITGALKAVLASAWSPVPGWGWMLCNGAISMLLALLILSGWPGTGLWTVGVFLGVDVLLAGFSRIVRSVSLSEFGGSDQMLPTPRA
jgi:uncharacterized membrane protein HdeD (DUF308 family)